MSDMMGRSTGLTEAQTAELAGALQSASNLSDLASAFTARANLGLAQAALGVPVYGVQMGLVGGSYQPIGSLSALGATRAGVGVNSFGRRLYGRHTPAALTDGQVIGGYNTEASAAIWRCDSGCSWTAYHFFGFGAVVAHRGGVILSGQNITDVDKLANNGLGIRRRPTLSGDLVAFCSNDSGTVSTGSGSLGVTPAADTVYVSETIWNGTDARVRVATVNQTTGVFGAWSSQVTLTTNLPLSSVGLCSTQNWYVVGTPASATAYVGGCVVLPWAVS
jgi:hypothetical protein